MSFSTLPHKTVGDLVTASDYNQIQDNTTVLKVPINNDGHVQWLTSVKSGNYTLTTSDDDVYFTATATATLPSAPATGKPYGIQASGAAVVVTVSGNGKNINGASTFILNPYDSATFKYNGTEYTIW